jgi:hypothetical protein
MNFHSDLMQVITAIEQGSNPELFIQQRMRPRREKSQTCVRRWIAVILDGAVY